MTKPGWSGKSDRGTTIIFEGLRIPEYKSHFPKRSDSFLRYFSAHFIADFLVGDGAKVTVDIEGNLTNYPEAVSSLVVGKRKRTGEFDHEEYGKLSITGFACKQEASTGLEGGHQLHFCLLYTSPSPRDLSTSRMPSSA